MMPALLPLNEALVKVQLPRGGGHATGSAAEHEPFGRTLRKAQQDEPRRTPADAGKTAERGGAERTQAPEKPSEAESARDARQRDDDRQPAGADARPDADGARPAPAGEATRTSDASTAQDAPDDAQAPRGAAGAAPGDLKGGAGDATLLPTSAAGQSTGASGEAVITAAQPPGAGTVSPAVPADLQPSTATPGSTAPAAPPVATDQLQQVAPGAPGAPAGDAAAAPPPQEGARPVAVPSAESTTASGVTAPGANAAPHSIEQGAGPSSSQPLPAEPGAPGAGSSAADSRAAQRGPGEINADAQRPVEPQRAGPPPSAHSAPAAQEQQQVRPAPAPASASAEPAAPPAHAAQGAADLGDQSTRGGEGGDARGGGNLPWSEQARAGNAASARALEIEHAVRFEQQTGQPASGDGALRPAAPALAGVEGARGGEASLNAPSGADPLEESSRFAGRIVRGLSAMVSQRGGVMTMRLDPPELGQLRVQMTMSRGAVSAVFEAQNAAAREMLERSMSTLRTALERHGLSVERLSVQVTPTSGGNGGSASSAGGDQSGASAQQRHDAAGGESRGRSDYGGSTGDDRRYPQGRFEQFVSAVGAGDPHHKATGGAADGPRSAR